MSHDKKLEWMNFPDGRARFAGGTRGWDESGHETFVIEVDGAQYFGEIKQTFLPNNNDFNIEIVSFGLPGEIFAGSSPASWIAFTEKDLRIAQSLIIQLVRAGLGLEDRPFVLEEFPNAHFMGRVIFRDGWALQKIEGDRSAPAQPTSVEVAR